MKPAGDPHLRFRQLISDRLDGALAQDDAVRLRVHLATCPRCRGAERAYLRDRHQMRLMRPLPPPRDLWARTAAALDREIARRPQAARRSRIDGRARRADSPALMLSALASLVLGIAVVGTQLGPSSAVSQAPNGPAAALPTPFDVPTQALAFVELTADGLAIYQTTVDRVCPPVAIDCAEVSTAHRRLVSAPGERTAVSLDLDEANGRLALLTMDDRGNDTVSVVILPRLTEQVPPLSGPLPADGPVGPALPPAASARVSLAPIIQPSSDPGAPEGTEVGTPDGTWAPSASGSATSTRLPTAPGTLPTAPGDPSASATSGASPHLPPSSDPSPQPPSSVAGSASGAGSSISLPSVSPVPAEMQAVLEDVQVVGVRPAWSSDGEMLAFSAMPADASRGPDVYTWRLGDTQAERLTEDGRSYFASWAGPRVVVSRLTTSATAGDAMHVNTVVIDPQTLLERVAAGDGGWLPAVDPSGRFAISWQGELEADERAVVPVRGALSMLDWRAIDPFADGALIVGAPDGGAGVAATATPAATATDAGETVDETPGTRPRRGERGERRQPSPMPQTSPAASEPPLTLSPLPTGEARPDQVPVEPERDARTDPVREWQVRWSEDSSAFGFWVTETPDAAWGQLGVLRVEPSSGSIDHETVLLAPTLARRSFTLGRDRVAWVAPSEDRPDGELRLRTWGPRGYGSLRIRGFDVSTGLPAF